MAFVDHQQRIVRQVVEQARRRFAGLAVGQIARVVLDTAAVAELLHHLQIETRALFQPLRFDQFVLLFQIAQAVAQFFADLLDRPDDGVARCRVMRFRVDRQTCDLAQHFAGQRVEITQRFDLFVEQLDAHGLAFRIRRVYVDHIAAHTVAAAPQLDVVARVLQFGQASQDQALIDDVAPDQVQDHRHVGLRIAEAVYRRYRRDHDGVLAFHHRLGRGQAHLLDVLVDRGVLLDEGVAGRHVGFGLVVIVIGNEILDRVVRKQLLHLAVELRCQGLVRCQHQRGPLDVLDDVGDGEGFAGTGHAEQCLARKSGFDAVDQRFDRLRLVAGRFEVSLNFKTSGH